MHHSPENVRRTRSLLQQFGWDSGLKRHREEIVSTEESDRHNEIRFFARWMAAERENYAEALELLQAAEANSAARYWAEFGHDFVAFWNNALNSLARSWDVSFGFDQ